MAIPTSKILLLVAGVSILLTPSSSSPNLPFFNQEQHHNINLSLDPQLNRIQSIAETSTVTFYDNDRVDERSVTTTPSSVLFCNGGDSFVTVTECRFDNDDHEFDSDEEEEEDDEESDDEDDDDDDGHSMILSNNSLRQSLSYYKENDGGKTLITKMINNKSHSRKQPIKTALFQSSSKHSSPVLNLRGGAAAPSNEFLKRLFVSALVTLLYEGAIGHLLEFLKIVYQTSPPGTTYLDVLKSITGEKGLAGIWDGFVPWGVIQAVFKGGVFGLALAASKSVLNSFQLPKGAVDTLAGGIAGGVQGYVLSPTLLLKTRVMTDDTFRQSMSLSQTCVESLKIGCKVVQNEGIPALMKGSNVFALKRMFDWSTRFYFSNLFAVVVADLLHKDSLNLREKALSDFLGGTASTLSTLPLDVLVATIQDAKKAGEHVSLSEMFAQEFKDGGWNGLRVKYTRGFIARLLHVCFTTIAMKTGTQVMYDALFG